MEKQEKQKSKKPRTVFHLNPSIEVVKDIETKVYQTLRQSITLVNSFTPFSNRIHILISDDRDVTSFLIENSKEHPKQNGFVQDVDLSNTGFRSLCPCRNNSVRSPQDYPRLLDNCQSAPNRNRCSLYLWDRKLFSDGRDRSVPANPYCQTSLHRFCPVKHRLFHFYISICFDQSR